MKFVYDKSIGKIKYDSKDVFHMLISTNIFNVYNCSKVLFKDNNIHFIKVDDLLKDIDSYEKSTGIMIGSITIAENDIYLFVFDYQIILINEADIPKFQIFFIKSKEKTPLYFLNSINQNKFYEMLNFKDQITTDQNNIQIDQANIIQKLQKRISKCIITKSQIRTVNRRINSKSSIDQKSIEFDLDDFIDINTFFGSNYTYLRFNIRDQFLYILKCFDSSDANSRLRFDREFSFFENHNDKNPFICRCYGIIEDKSSLLNIIIIEYIEGQTLNNFIQNFQLNDEQRIQIIIEILCAFEYLHLNNFMYRDLKSDNIIIDSNLNAILIDFDRLKKFDGEKLTSDFGSPIFISPEQYTDNYSFSTDIYSLGKIINLILTGELDIQNSSISTKFLSFYDKYKFCLSNNPKERPNISNLLTNAIYIFSGLKKICNKISLIRKNLFDSIIEKSTTENMKEEIYELYSYVGMMYYDNEVIPRDFDKAFNLLNKAASHNNSDALFNLGGIYYTGELIHRNIKKAIQCLERSSDLKNSYSQYILGIIYYDGECVPVNIEKAIHYLTLSSEQNNSDAQQALGYIYYDEEYAYFDIEKAIHYFTLSENQNDPSSMLQLGEIYSEGKYVPVNIEKAIHYLTLSSKNNNKYAHFKLGEIFYNGSHVPRDINKAIYYFTLSSNFNNSNAQYYLGKIYCENKYVPVNIEKAIYYLTLSSKQDNYNAQLYLGEIFYNGSHVPRDINKAIYYFTLSSNFNNSNAQYYLGKIYCENKYVPVNIEKAIYYLTLSSKQDDYNAQFYLGKIYYFGVYVPTDINKALYYFTLSSSLDNENAQFYLGKIYYENKYVPRDINKAIFFFKLSASQGNAAAQFILGRIYYNNKYVQRNTKEAIKYLTSSADQYNSDAQFYLGQIYYEGRYVARNITKAIHYFKEASCLNNQYAKNNLGVIYLNGDGVVKNAINAIEYFEEAIRIGNDSFAMFNLARILYFGIDTKPNIEKSIKLLEKLSENFFGEANIFLNFIRKKGPEFPFKETDKNYDPDKIMDRLTKYNEDFYIHQYNYYKELDLIYNVNHTRYICYDAEKRVKFIMKKLINIDFRKCINDDFYKGFYDE